MYLIPSVSLLVSIILILDIVNNQARIPPGWSHYPQKLSEK